MHGQAEAGCVQLGVSEDSAYALSYGSASHPDQLTSHASIRSPRGPVTAMLGSE